MRHSNGGNVGGAGGLDVIGSAGGRRDETFSLYFSDFLGRHIGAPPATFLLTLIYLAANSVTQKTQMAKAEFHRDF